MFLGLTSACIERSSIPTEAPYDDSMDADVDGSRSMVDGADLNDASDGAAQDATAPRSDLSIEADETPTLPPNAPATHPSRLP